MPSDGSVHAWFEGEVDPHSEHLELTYGSVIDDIALLPVARVGRPVADLPNQFIVQFVNQPSWDTERTNEARQAARRSLDFYLVELGKSDSWAYALYHCSSAANVYAEIHWGHRTMERFASLPDWHFTHYRLAERSNLFQTEGAGTFWAWVWPELLGWESEISWLLSPVNDRHRWPGDLWGLDQHGELLLVETKRITKSKRAEDPFVDYVSFAAEQRVPTVDVITAHWERQFGHEQRFIQERAKDLEAGNRRLETRPGILDCSLQRLMVWRWRELYLEHIAPDILSGEYEKRVRRNLVRRPQAGNPPPHYFALFTLFDDTLPKLAAKGLTHLNLLVGHAGTDHVHARAVTGKPVDGGKVRVTAFSVDLLHSLP